MCEFSLNYTQRRLIMLSSDNQVQHLLCLGVNRLGNETIFSIFFLLDSENIHISWVRGLVEYRTTTESSVGAEMTKSLSTFGNCHACRYTVLDTLAALAGVSIRPRSTIIPALVRPSFQQRQISSSR